MRSEIIEKLIFIEGGYVDNPYDSGGKTKYGITEQTLRNFGYEKDIISLTKEEAIDIYTKGYWNRMTLDDFDNKIIQETLLKIGVHSGTGNAIRFLQRSLNVLNNRQKYYDDLKVDGFSGKNTISAYNRFIQIRRNVGITVLDEMINSLYGSFLVGLVEKREKDEVFIYGWFANRFN